MLVSLLASCSGSGDSGCGGIIEPTRVVTLEPQSLTLDPGAAAPVGATLSGGCSTDDRTVQWRTADPTIATVDGNGRVTAVASGVTNLTATTFSDRATASIPITVRPRTPTTLSLAPRLDTLVPLRTQTLTVTVSDQTGTPLTSAPVVFRSLTPTLATVSNVGVVSAIAPGTALIEAAVQKAGADSLRDTVRVLIVTPCSLIQPLPLGTTVTGALDASTCPSLLNYRSVDQYSVTAAAQAYYAVRLGRTTPMALVPLVVSNTLHGLPVADTTTTAFVVTRAGTFTLFVTAPSSNAGAYTLTTAIDPDPKASCVSTDVTLGVSFRTAITPTCLSRDIRILPALSSAQLLRVTGVAAGFPVTLELRNASSGALLQRSIATAAGAQATITYVSVASNQLVRIRVIGPSGANDFVTISVAQ